MVSCACTRRRPGRAGATACLEVKEASAAGSADMPAAEATRQMPCEPGRRPYSRRVRVDAIWAAHHAIRKEPAASMELARQIAKPWQPVQFDAARFGSPIVTCTNSWPLTSVHGGTAAAVETRLREGASPKKVRFAEPTRPELHDLAARYPHRVSSRRHVEKALLELHVCWIMYRLG